MTRKSNALRSNGSHISMIGHITRDELRENLTETDKANGFANRILWACVKRSKELARRNRNSLRRPGARFPDKVKQAVERAREVERMRRDEDAQAIWRTVYHKLSEGQPGMFGAMTARGDAYVLRLSCLYALLDRSSVSRRGAHGSGARSVALLRGFGALHLRRSARFAVGR